MIAKMLVRIGLLCGLAQAHALFAIEGLMPPTTGQTMGQYSEIIGLDLDSDGIRDDVGQFIESSYTRTTEMAAARQFARAVQAAVLAGSREPRMTRLISLQMSRALNCVYVSFAGNASMTHPESVIETVRSLTTNTPERLNAYLAFAKSQDDTAYDLPRGASCI